jgi:hypothetical protein
MNMILDQGGVKMILVVMSDHRIYLGRKEIELISEGKYSNSHI